ncbi:MAG: hypothetical protein ACI87E_002286 [Mariniblastus sp.]
MIEAVKAAIVTTRGAHKEQKMTRQFLFNARNRIGSAFTTSHQHVGKFGLLIALIVATLISCDAVSAQDNAGAQIPEHLDAGEYPKAIEAANSLQQDQRDQWLSKIARSQMQSGAALSAYQTAETIGYDTARAGALNDLSAMRRGGNAGAGGGITEADFQPLMELIQGTVQPDSWQDTGQGLGTIQAYPAGVFVDPSGTLKKIKTKKIRGAEQFRKQAQLDSGNRQVTFESAIRKVSLTRLEKAAQILAAQGKPVDAAMSNLAGIYEVKYLMMYPETGDIVLAGPAGPWQLNEENRPVNIATGKPVLQLDDLVVCLRNAWENDGKFGCSITPRKAQLASTKQFLANTKLTGKRWAEGIRLALGQQDVEVFGIDADTHAARVLVEADYRMKLVGMGLEATIPEVPSYLDRIKLTPDGNVPPMDVVRWWFTLNYDDIVADAARSTFTFNGTGVKVLSETEFIDDQGERVHTGTSHGPTKSFARDFTNHFDAMADEYPVYRQLKNVFDMALVASLIRNQDLSSKTQWNRTFFGSAQSDSDGRLVYQVRRDRVATQVDSVLNDKILKIRKSSSTIKHHIVGVSGGISFNVSEILEKGIQADVDGGLAEESLKAKPDAEELTWWWD